MSREKRKKRLNVSCQWRMLPRSKRLGQAFRNWYGSGITRAKRARASRKTSVRINIARRRYTYQTDSNLSPTHLLAIRAQSTQLSGGPAAVPPLRHLAPVTGKMAQVWRIWMGVVAYRGRPTAALVNHRARRGSPQKQMGRLLRARDFMEASTAHGQHDV